MSGFRSKNEKQVSDLLVEIFPNTRIEHDHPLGGGLKLDFLVRSIIKLGIEVDGIQHYEFSRHFHRDAEGWRQQQARDAKKEQRCREEGILLIRVDARKADFSEFKKILLEAVETAEELPEKQVPEWEQRAKERTRAFRKEQYSRMKKRK